MAARRISLSEALDHIARITGSRSAAESQLLQSLRRGELQAVADIWGPRERYRAIITGKGHLTLHTAVFEYASIERDIPDILSWPKRWPVPGQISREEDKEYAHGVHLDREDVIRLWPSNAHSSNPAPDSEYLTPFIVMAMEAITHFKITPEGPNPKKEELIAYFLQKKLPDGAPISKNLADMLATFSRPPDGMKGGNKRS